MVGNILEEEIIGYGDSDVGWKKVLKIVGDGVVY